MQNIQSSRYDRAPIYSDQPLEVLFLRHAKSAGNLASQLLRAGNLPSDMQARLEQLLRIDWDIPLVPEGLREAMLLGQALRTDPFFDIKKIDAVMSANYTRSRQTTYEFLRAVGFDEQKLIELNPTIGERDWGEHHLQDLQKRSEAEVLRHEDPFCWSPQLGESMRSARERVQHAFSTLNRRFGGKRVLMVTHGEFIISALAEVTRTYDQKDFSNLLRTGIPNCGLIQLSRLSPEGVESQHYTHIRRFGINVPEHFGDYSGNWEKIILPQYNLTNLVAPHTERAREILSILQQDQR